MKPDISEFSYGYALTEALIWDTGLPVIGAPIFPSLIQEGQSGGYDVAISFNGIFLFLQFKLSHYMKRGTADEMKQGILNVPFYRMHLRPARHSRQHQMLLDLEASGELVYYAAPKFHLPSELNRAYLDRMLIQRSLFIRPSTIGRLLDDDEHHISFRNGYPVYLCSKPKKIREEEHSESSLKEFHNIIGNNEFKKYDNAGIGKIADKMLSIVLKHQVLLRRTPFSPENIHKLRDMKPIEKIRFLSRTFFDCEPVIIKARNKVE